MTTLIQTMMEMERGDAKGPMFPHAPQDWTPRLGRTAAKAEGLVLTDEHWVVVAGVASVRLGDGRAEVRKSDRRPARVLRDVASAVADQVLKEPEATPEA